MTESIEEARARYMAAAHAMQSGVKAKMEIFPDGETSPKHLRVGVNAAMTEHNGLATLLIAKGVITEEEYTVAMADAMEKEKELYEKELSEHYGTNITLG